MNSNIKIITIMDKILSKLFLLLSMRLKIYQLGISKVYLSGHPKAGQGTNFKHKISTSIISCYSNNSLELIPTDFSKIHTCRKDFDYWARIIQEVNEGRGVLSLRQWEGEPYRSKRPEFMQIRKAGIERLDISVKNIKDSDPHAATVEVFIGGKKIDSSTFDKLAQNDGLADKVDLLDWLGWEDLTNAAIIHFTSFRYQPT